jgi:hypothetical protein
MLSPTKHAVDHLRSDATTARAIAAAAVVAFSARHFLLLLLHAQLLLAGSQLCLRPLSPCNLGQHLDYTSCVDSYAAISPLGQVVLFTLVSAQAAVQAAHKLLPS